MKQASFNPWMNTGTSHTNRQLTEVLLVLYLSWRAYPQFMWQSTIPNILISFQQWMGNALPPTEWVKRISRHVLYIYQQTGCEDMITMKEKSAHFGRHHGFGHL